MSSITFLCGPLDVGGAGKMVKYVSGLCVDVFNAVSVISLDDKTRSAGLNEKIDFVGLDSNGGAFIIWRLRLIHRLRNLIKSRKPDVICAFTSEVAVMSWVATIGLRNIVFVSAERGDPYTLPLIWKVLVSWVYSKSDYCFFQLEKARDYFGKHVIQKSFVIHNSFEPEEGVKPYFGERDKTIVSAGRFVSEKRFEVLIKAFARVKNAHPDYKLIIYGEGPYKEKYESLSVKLGVDRDVFFPGYVNNVAKAVQKAGVFVLSSKYEGIPNVLIEAMSTGIPVVSTDCTPGGPCFLTDNGRRGILVPVDDHDAIADAIISIIDNASLREQLSRSELEILPIVHPEVVSRMWKDSFSKIIEYNNIQ